MAASAMQRSISKMIVREDEVEQRAALEEEKARRERAKKLRRAARRKRSLERKQRLGDELLTRRRAKYRLLAAVPGRFPESGAVTS